MLHTYLHTYPYFIHVVCIGSNVPCPFNGYHRCIEDNQCIPLEYVCDRDNDCSEGSDENDCGKFVVLCMYFVAISVFTMRM